MRNVVFLKLKRFNIQVFLTLGLLFFVSINAFAAPTFSIQGQITNADGTIYTYPGVNFLVRVMSPGPEACVLYSETQTKDLSYTGGFSLLMNDGSGTRADGNSFSFIDAFSNLAPFTVSGSNCAAGTGTVTYTPQPDDERKMIVYFKDSTMTGWEQMPTTTLGHSAFSFDSLRVGGFPSNALCRVATGTTPATVAPLTPANFQDLLDLINGVSNKFVKSSNGTGATLPSFNGAPSAVAAGSLWYDTATQSLRYNNGSTNLSLVSGPTTSGVVYSVSATAPVVVSGPTSTPTISVNAATTAASGVVTLATNGGTTASTAVQANDSRLTNSRTPSGSASGDLTGTYPNPNLAATAVTAGNYGTATQTPSFTVDSKGRITSAANTNIIFPVTTVAGRSGAITLDASDLTSAAAKYLTYKPNNIACTEGQVLKWDNTNSRWSCATDLDSSSGGFISSLTINAPLTNSGTATAPNLSISAATTSTPGIITLAANNGTTANTVVQANDSRLTDSRAPAGSAGGDLSGTYPNPSVAKIQGTAISVTAPVTGQFLKFGGAQWAGAGIYLSDLQSAFGGALFSSPNCASNETLSWNSGADQFTCISIGSLNASAVSAGTLSDSRLSANIPRLTASNQWTAGSQDFSAAESLKVPVSAGATPTEEGKIAYDNSADQWRVGVNGVSHYLITAASALTSGQILQGNAEGKISASGLTISASGSVGIAPSNSGVSNSLARNDHVHKVVSTLQWFFPGLVASGVQAVRGQIPLGVTNCTIVGTQISANTSASTSSSFNVERCTAAGPSCASSANIYSSNIDLAANVESASAPTPDLASLNAGDIFRVNMASIGTGLSDVSIAVTYKCDNTN